MPPEVVSFIAHYGYLSVFIIIFLQEVGIPNPVPNELVLLFCGYLSMKGILFLPVLILVALSADFTGTSILYGIFYFLGKKIVRHLPPWFPLSKEKINQLAEKLSKAKSAKIYLCRLTPYVRGYTSIITGLLQMSPKRFLPISLLAAVTWSSAYIIAGRILGPYWVIAGNKLGNAKYYVLITALVILIIIPVVRYFRNRSALKSGESL